MTRKVLGRGLDALIPINTNDVEEEGAERIHMVPTDRIVPNPRQPRREFDGGKLDGLSQSIRELGVLEPIILRGLEDDRFELIAGERRFRAAQQAGLQAVPALIRGYEGRQSLEVALIENLQREDLNPIDEARAYQRLVEEFDRTHAEISRDVGKDRSTISNLIRLLRLPEDVLVEVSRGTLTPGHARVLLAVEGVAEQSSLAQTMIREAWSVRRAEQYLSRKGNEKAQPSETDAEIARERHRNPEVTRVEEALRYALGTEVHLYHTGGSGRIEVRYSSREELERVLELLGIQIH